ncbi:unnamed protein product [Polarella glacialis]|uniref:SGNH hydrolase-type esterase domain-containing protein n=1 Tax=Polarella glacialis TaxID=89957 RepID=A0A813JU45_POLGL|nr:unnamed protein product [Polarella glacialis]
MSDSQRWPCSTFSLNGAYPQAWDFGAWQADVVTINLGTNDYGKKKKKKKKKKKNNNNKNNGDPTPAQFQAAYGSFISQVRSKYPNALIACLAPLSWSCSGGAAKWKGREQHRGRRSRTPAARR